MSPINLNVLQAYQQHMFKTLYALAARSVDLSDDINLRTYLVATLEDLEDQWTTLFDHLCAGEDSKEFCTLNMPGDDEEGGGSLPQ